MRVTFDELAEQEAREHVHWYKQRNPDSGEQLAELFIATSERIARNPLQFPLMESEENPGDVRRARLDDFPIVVVYQLFEDEAFVVALAHTSREPWYWRGRLRR